MATRTPSLLSLNGPPQAEVLEPRIVPDTGAAIIVQQESTQVDFADVLDPAAQLAEAEESAITAQRLQKCRMAS